MVFVANLCIAEFRSHANPNRYNPVDDKSRSPPSRLAINDHGGPGLATVAALKFVTLLTFFFS